MNQVKQKRYGNVTCLKHRVRKAGTLGGSLAQR